MSLVQTASSSLCVFWPATPWQPVMQGFMEQCLTCGGLKLSRTKLHLACCSATKEQTAGINEPIELGLDDALEYIVDDELVEVKMMRLGDVLPCVEPPGT